MTHRETLVILERIFDIIMELDKLKEDQPDPEAEPELVQHWYAFRTIGLEVVLTFVQG